MAMRVRIPSSGRMDPGSLVRGLIVAVALGGTGLTMAARADATGPYTPDAASTVRRAIVDGLRAAGERPERRVVVADMRVQDGWAWVVADPQSRDGRERFERESALMQRVGAQWRVVAQPCGDAGCETAREIRRIRKEFSEAPAAIFPRG